MARDTKRRRRGKQSLTLNGWDGGLNVDKDASDITSDGKGKDEAVTLTRVFADIPGKLKAGYPDVENSSSMAPSSPVSYTHLTLPTTPYV